jgi:5-methylcytosine-specific restriction endonuclease McrA
VGILRNELESTDGATEVSKVAFAIKYFTVVLLLGFMVTIALWYMFGMDFFKVLGVSLALATLCVLGVLDGGWFGSTPQMMVFGLIVAVPVWLIFDTGFFTVLAVSVLWGLLWPLLKGKEYREAARRRQQQARLELGQERLKGEQGEKSFSPSSQDAGASGCAHPVRPQDLRAMPYEQYLQTPHWKRMREDELRAAGRRCQLCNRGSRILDVHHRTYERRGEELDEDLIVLCRECHDNFHKHRRLGR